MKEIDLKELAPASLACLLTKYETEYGKGMREANKAFEKIEKLFNHAKSQGIDLFEIYKNERRL